MAHNNLYMSLPTGDNLPEEVNVVIEISKDSKIKYEFDHDMGIMKLDRVLHAPMAFPVNYGFVPQCWNTDDNDPVDAIVLCSETIQTGVLVECRVIGMFQMVDSGEKDDKIICIPTDDPNMDEVKTVDDLPAHFRKQIEFYYGNYKRIKNKEVIVEGFKSKDEAVKHIEEGIAAHKEKFGA